MNTNVSVRRVTVLC